MSVYILYDYFFPAYKAGGPIQSLVNLVQQIQYTLPVKVVCGNTDHDETVLEVKTDTWTALGNAKVYYTTEGFKGVKKAISNEAPVLFINGLYSLPFNFLPALKIKARRIVSVRGMLHPGALSQKRIKKMVYLALWKLMGLHRKCEYHATTAEEKSYIENVFGKEVRVWVIPNVPNIVPFQQTPLKKEGEIILCTAALISPMKNYLNVLKSLAKCDDCNITYHIYGPVKDEAYWQLCKQAISQLPGNITVNYYGSIEPSEVTAKLAAAHVYIQPSKSENFGHSIFEALCTGLPVITSHNTPWNNLVVSKAGCNVDAENEIEIAQAIRSFVEMDEHAFSTWRNAARDHALSSVDVPAIKDQYNKMFLSAYSKN